MSAGLFHLNTPSSDWAKALAAGDRRALSRLLTFAESSLPEQQALVDDVLAQTKETGAFRVGVSGAPGAGKSSLLETLGTHLIEQGKTVCVLAIDPSSRVSGGSILGDKTRMTRLSAAEKAFIRPSPSGLGEAGVSSYTSRSLALCDRAGFEFVFLETVGVGQAELGAVTLVDCFVMVVSPSGGDELQGMKRGITEHADIVVVNKMDQDRALAQRTLQSYAGALHLLRGKEVPTLQVSAREGTNIDGLSEELSRFCAGLTTAGRERRKEEELEREFWRALTRTFEDEMRARRDRDDGALRRRIDEVRSGTTLARQAAHQALSELIPDRERARR